MVASPCMLLYTAAWRMRSTGFHGVAGSLDTETSLGSSRWLLAGDELSDVICVIDSFLDLYLDCGELDSCNFSLSRSTLVPVNENVCLASESDARLMSIARVT
ncbi:hypothetical protein OGATHE_000326 [Ogataea polymorpha]|uniref:Uncharacterized protein n=1 Tax=Ogataea polymorpha TaxID=460523 RepID=A0A9P8PSU0_9ASCO|nr:hypothetical protein OGATHE_000326 [Ogataea polymorpha]